MRAIFISYRRDDAEGQAGRLFKDLSERFGEDSVFMDVVDIEPGRDFRRAIDQQVASCGVLLAMIGRSWLDAKDESGRRRLDDPVDFVRLETGTALKRDIPVIPVLVQGARMPKAEQLPQDLADLAFRNAVELTHARWDSDVQLLIKALRPHVGGGNEPAAGARPPAEPAPAPPPSAHGGVVPVTGTGPRRMALFVAATVAVLVIAVGAYVAYDRAQHAAAEQAEAQKAAQDKARQEAQAAKEAQDKAAAQAEADKAAAEKARQEAQAAKEAQDKALAKAEAERAIAEAQAAKAAADAAAARAEAEKTQAEKAAAERAAQSQPAPRPRSRVPPQVVRFDGSFVAMNPCTGLNVNAKGTTTLTIQTLPDRVFVAEQFAGSGSGFEVSYSGSAEFPRPAPSYDVAIRGQWNGRGMQFASAGIDRVFASPEGVPTGDAVQRLTNSCR